MKYRLNNLDTYISMLNKIADPYTVEEMIEKAVEDGSKIVDETTVKELNALPEDNRPYVEGKRKSITKLQRIALLKAFGTSPIETKKDFTNDKTGVDRSVNKLGQPAVVIARRLENGTSYMDKNPVFSRATRKARKPCIEEMQKSLDQSYRSIMK